MLRVLVVILVVFLASSQEQQQNFDAQQYQQQLRMQEQYERRHQQQRQRQHERQQARYQQQARQDHITKSQQVLKSQQQIRQSNSMTYTNVKSYTFVCGRFDDFILLPSAQQQIKFQMHVYWKKQNVYVSAEYRQGEEIRIIVYEDNARVLIDRQFYTTTGITFLAKKGSRYTVRFLASGAVTKLVAMLNSSPLQVMDKLATKQHIASAHQKVQGISNELKALMTISQRNYLIKDQLQDKILSSTKIYLGYEIFQVLLIIGVAILQVTSLTRLLKGGSIV